MNMFRAIATIIAIAAAPRNVAVDSNPIHLCLHGISCNDFQLGADPATLIAAKMSSHELSSTVIWADPYDGYCLASSALYPYASYSPISTTPSEVWCKAWCEQMQPNKVVGMIISNTACWCLFSADDLPSPPLQYNPQATDSSVFSGMDCIAGTTSDPNYKCYRNCAYKQCVVMVGFVVDAARPRCCGRN